MEEEKQHVARQIQAHIAQLLPLLEKADDLNLTISIKQNFTKGTGKRFGSQRDKFPRISVTINEENISIKKY